MTLSLATDGQVRGSDCPGRACGMDNQPRIQSYVKSIFCAREPPALVAWAGAVVLLRPVASRSRALHFATPPAYGTIAAVAPIIPFHNILSRWHRSCLGAGRHCI
jgi:hypothetical protein